MTDTTEQKALALLNEVRDERGFRLNVEMQREDMAQEALCRAIEQHEAFRQEVSDGIAKLLSWPSIRSQSIIVENLARFIIAKPDPLVEVLDEALWEVCNVKLTDRELRAVSLRLNAKRGGKIVWGEG